MSKVWEASPVRARHDPLEVSLDLHGILLAGEPQALREAPHMRVDDDPLGVAELGCDDVRGLASDTGKSHEILQSPRNLAVELLEQHAHGAADRLRLLPEEAGRVDVSLELLLRHGEVVLRPAVLLKKRSRHTVDVDVGRLGRQHHRDEELERAAETKRDRRVGVLRCEPFDDRPDPLTSPSETPAPSLADVATRHARLRRRPSPRPGHVGRATIRSAAHGATVPPRETRPLPHPHRTRCA